MSLSPRRILYFLLLLTLCLMTVKLGTEMRRIKPTWLDWSNGLLTWGFLIWCTRLMSRRFHWSFSQAGLGVLVLLSCSLLLSQGSFANPWIAQCWLIFYALEQFAAGLRPYPGSTGRNFKILFSTLVLTWAFPLLALPMLLTLFGLMLAVFYRERRFDPGLPFSEKLRLPQVMTAMWGTGLGVAAAALLLWAGGSLPFWSAWEGTALSLSPLRFASVFFAPGGGLLSLAPALLLAAIYLINPAVPKRLEPTNHFLMGSWLIFGLLLTLVQGVIQLPGQSWPLGQFTSLTAMVSFYMAFLLLEARMLHPLGRLLVVFFLATSLYIHWVEFILPEYFIEECSIGLEVCRLGLLLSPFIHLTQGLEHLALLWPAGANLIGILLLLLLALTWGGRGKA